MNKVLIADDEQDLVLHLQQQLLATRPDWRIWTATTAEQAIQEVQTTEFDLIITDWMFDRSSLTGSDIVLAARKKDPLCMIIVMSSFQGEKMDRYKDALAIGAYDMIDKTDPEVILHRELSFKGQMALELRASCYLRASFSRHIDSRVVTAYQQESNTLAFDSRPLTIMFTDIRGFSKLNNHLMAQNKLVAKFLTQMYQIIVDVSHQWSGMVDKFMGDGAMILFGTPSREPASIESQIDDAYRAVCAALELQTKITPIIANFRAEFENVVSVEWENLEIGIGIHSAEVLVGVISTSERDQFTALGHGVNLAQRFESAAGRFSENGTHKMGSILISQTVKAKVLDRFMLKDEGILEGMKNIDGRQPAWSVLGVKGIDGSSSSIRKSP